MAPYGFLRGDLCLLYALSRTVVVKVTEMAARQWTFRVTPTPEAMIPAADTPGRRLEVVVLHTTTPGTLHALGTAAGLANGLGARIRLLVPQVVGYPLPLNAPPVPAEFTERRFRTIAAGAAIETRIDLRLCRDRWETLKSALGVQSLVVLGGRRRWWPTSETWLAARLRRLGHRVIFASLT